MWTRKELKQTVKSRLSINYWKMVLVAFIISLVAGGFPSLPDLTITNSFDNGFNAGFEESFNDGLSEDFDEDLNFDDMVYDGLYTEGEEVKFGDLLGFSMIFIFILGVIFLIVFVFATLFAVFVAGPLEIGCRRFFTKNLKEKADLRELTYGFDHNYLNIVKITFFQILYIFLWSLLFIIPGIVKTFEYMMIPYLLAENPSMSKEEAFARSKEMMMGQKWNAFVLNLSFFGWILLSGITFGLVGLFYAAPYYEQTMAALYEKLKPQQEVLEVYEA